MYLECLEDKRCNLKNCENSLAPSTLIRFMWAFHFDFFLGQTHTQTLQSRGWRYDCLVLINSVNHPLFGTPLPYHFRLHHSETSFFVFKPYSGWTYSAYCKSWNWFYLWLFASIWLSQISLCIYKIIHIISIKNPNFLWIDTIFEAPTCKSLEP